MTPSFWRMLQDEAPRALALCLDYFQLHYGGPATEQLLRPRAVLAYLQTQGYQLTITQFGIPNRDDWYFEIHLHGEFLVHQRGYRSKELALQVAVQAVFVSIEAS